MTKSIQNNKKNVPQIELHFLDAVGDANQGLHVSYTGIFSYRITPTSNKSTSGSDTTTTEDTVPVSSDEKMKEPDNSFEIECLTQNHSHHLKRA